MSSNNGLSILDLNLCNAFTKYDKLAIFINRVNKNNPISSTFSASEYFSEIEKFHGFQHINTSRITLHRFLG